MNELRITNLEVEQFLRDFEQNSKTQILEEGKEKKEVIEIAKAKGIDLKDNKDLAGFKTIYTFANEANKNQARLPKSKLLKALPTLIGKPVDIDHNRRYVVGHYIDYRYRQKEAMVIAYGVFYKSNFGDEWEEAKKLFKQNKLATSYEIWCPKNKRKDLKDGTYELLSIELAGGALLFKEEPAFEDAKVLELAKSNIDKQPEDLIYASKYKDEDIITSNTKIEVLNKDKPAVVIPPIKEKLKCSNCEEEFEVGLFGDIKCPKCFAILDKSGKMIYPPQIQDFKVLCSSCKINNWLILSNTDKTAKLRCKQCAKEYDITFATEKARDILNKVHFVYTGVVSCLQCNKSIHVSGTSMIKTRELKCKKCGLTFAYDINESNRYKKVSKIIQIKKEDTLKDNQVVKSAKIGGQEMEIKINTDKFHRYTEDFEALEKSCVIVEGLEEAKKRENLLDSDFATIVRVRDKKTDKIKKIRMFPINDEANVKSSLVKLEKKDTKDTLKRLGVSSEVVKAKLLEKASVEKSDINKVDKATEKVEKAKDVEKKEEVKVEKKPEAVAKKESAIDKAVKQVVDIKKELEVAKTQSKEKIALFKSGVKKAIKKYLSLKKEFDSKIEFYKANARKIIERRIELGDDTDLTDEAILNDDKFALAKAEKENLLLKASKESTSDSVGTKSNGRDGLWYAKKRKEIDAKTEERREKNK